MYSTIQEVYDEIITAKNAEVELSGLNSSSSTAIYKLWAWIVATAIFSFQKVMSQFQTDIDKKLDEKNIHNTLWYGNKILEFQYGDSITLINYQPKYAIVNEAAKIIKKVSVRDSNGFVNIKVAKEVSNELVKLSNDELVAARAYLSQIKDAGVGTSLVSLDADLFKPYINIFYDGQYNLANMQTTIADAINAHLKEYSFNNFDQKFLFNHLVDKLQLVPGVKDVELVNMQFKPASGASYTSYTRVYLPEAGYIKIAPGHNISNNSVIQFIAE